MEVSTTFDIFRRTTKPAMVNYREQPAPSIIHNQTTHNASPSDFF